MKLECQFHISYEHYVKSVQIRSFFCSVFSYIWTKYGDLRRKSRYSVRMQEYTDWKKLRTWTLFTQWKTIITIYRYCSYANFRSFIFIFRAKWVANSYVSQFNIATRIIREQEKQRQIWNTFLRKMRALSEA